MAARRCRPGMCGEKNWKKRSLSWATSPGRMWFQVCSWCDGWSCVRLGESHGKPFLGKVYDSIKITILNTYLEGACITR